MLLPNVYAAVCTGTPTTTYCGTFSGECGLTGACASYDICNAVRNCTAPAPWYSPSGCNPNPGCAEPQVCCVSREVTCSGTIVSCNQQNEIGCELVPGCVWDSGGGNTPTCGNGIIDSGEECDDNNIVSGDGCQSTCNSEWLNITGASLSAYDCDGNTCYPGDALRLSLNVKGDALYKSIYGYPVTPDWMDTPDFIYVNASSSDGSCKIQLNGNIEGMYWNVSYENTWPNFFKCIDWPDFYNCAGIWGYIPDTMPVIPPLNYMVPNIPASCINKQLTRFTVDIREITNQPDTSVVYTPYHGTISPGIMLKTCGDGIKNGVEQCDGNDFGSATCSTYGYSSGNLVCTGMCTINTGVCRHTIENVAYDPTFTPTTQGCNPDLRICGRNGRINVSVRVHNLDSTGGGTYVDLTLKNDPPIGQDACQIFDIDYTASAPDNNGFINYTYNINPALFNINPAACYNKSINHTVLSVLKEGGPSGAVKSNVFDGPAIGFRLNECGDGEIDYDPDLLLYEQCDYNLSTHSWMTKSCAALGQGWSGGVAACNQVSCKWDNSSCFRCGDGVKNDVEECDDGNLYNNDECNNVCQITYCGNNVKNLPSGKNYSYSPAPPAPPYFGKFEWCDDGNLNNNDYCLNTCNVNTCGDNYTRIGYEECDDGNINSNDFCHNCLFTYCGDGYIQRPNGVGQNGTFNGTWGWEQCDGLNSSCARNCTFTFCGDGVTQAPNGVGLGGPLNDGYEQCDGGSGCSPTCTLVGCGNGIVDPREECDDGGVCQMDGRLCRRDSDCVNDGDKCLPRSGDGCSASCQWTDCDVIDVRISCPGGVCGKGDLVSVIISYVGRHCNLANLAQTDFYNLAPGCKIQYVNNPIFEMQGMNSTFYTLGGSPFRFDYVVPNVPDSCAGKILNIVTTGLYQHTLGGDLGLLRTNSLYTTPASSVRFNQCKQFGPVSNYTNYGVDIGYDVITNTTTNCYYQTCNDLDANPVRIDAVNFGVTLKDNDGGYTNFFCDALMEDFICPDDFEYNGRCTSTGGGICAVNGVIDADCELKTPMKCGKVWNGTVYIDTCKVPLIGNPPTPPSKYCIDSSMCVYANETSGDNRICVAVNHTTRNAINKTIQCSVQNTWCPLGYQFNGLYCVNPVAQCSVDCFNVTSVVTRLSDPARLKDSRVWWDYLDDPDCFLENQTTDRRRAYCGVGYVWPVLNYHYLPVGVAYWKFNVDDGTWSTDMGNDGVPIIVG